MSYFDLFRECKLCPRKCGVNRFQEKGYCGSIIKYKNNEIFFKCNLIEPFFYEEPCINPQIGTCNIFFSGCNLKCVYCQNYQISHNNSGKYISFNHFIDVINNYINKGFTYINFVTPTHYLPIVLMTIKIINNDSIKFIYNTNGYENESTLKIIKFNNIIFLTDLKYTSDYLGKKYSNCDQYFTILKRTLSQMVKLSGEPVFLNSNLLSTGTIVRHLVLPNQLLNSIRTINYLSKNYSEKIIFSLMSQYIPQGKSYLYPEINRKILPHEYHFIKNYLENKNLLDGYTQDLDSAVEHYIPNFY